MIKKKSEGQWTHTGSDRVCAKCYSDMIPGATGVTTNSTTVQVSATATLLTIPIKTIKEKKKVEVNQTTVVVSKKSKKVVEPVVLYIPEDEDSFDEQANTCELC